MMKSQNIHHNSHSLNILIPVMDHQLLHSQQSIVADQLVFMVHVIHHQLFSTQLLNYPENGGKKLKDG